MAESAPDALKWLASRIAPDLGGVLSGIVGDSAHTRGYHRGRAYVPSTDYSVQLTEDKKGDSYSACAIDMSFSADKMKLYTGRLKAAAERNDPRVKCVREFYGTLNGTDVFGRIHEGSGDGTWRYSTSDKSHLWHVHMSILREYSNNRTVMQGILDVLMGKPLATTVEDFVMATKDEVKAALREVILEAAPWQASGVGKRLTAKGWGEMSARSLLEYIFEGSVATGAELTNVEAELELLKTQVAGVDEAVLEQIKSQPTPEATAAVLKAVLGADAEAVFRAGLGQ